MTAIPSRVRQLVNGVWQYVTFDEGGGGGGGSPMVGVVLSHSADVSNLSGSCPIGAQADGLRTTITLPPTAFGNNGSVRTLVSNFSGADVNVTGFLVVQNADGTVWLQQGAAAQLFIDGSSSVLDFSSNDGGAGAGLTWNGVDLRIDIATAGAYSAFVSLFAEPV